MSLAVSAINGCEMCVRAHEKTVSEGGLTADYVNAAVRIAATINATAVALEAGETAAGSEVPLVDVSAQGTQPRTTRAVASLSAERARRLGFLDEAERALGLLEGAASLS